jgi:hypothetical protein
VYAVDPNLYEYQIKKKSFIIINQFFVVHTLLYYYIFVCDVISIRNLKHNNTKFNLCFLRFFVCQQKAQKDPPFSGNNNNSFIKRVCVQLILHGEHLLVGSLTKSITIILMHFGGVDRVLMVCQFGKRLKWR